jgi:hypothetical protein
MKKPIIDEDRLLIAKKADLLATLKAIVKFLETGELNDTTF